MKKIVLIATLAVGGVLAAVAVAAGTTGTVSVCATATDPSHTVAVDGTGVKTIAGASNSQCATTTYTIPTTTQTVTNTTTVTQTVTVPSGGTPQWDGRASSMTQLSESGSPPNVNQTIVPSSSWDCTCFTHNDIALASDATFGKEYAVNVTTGDTNPWGGSDAIDGAAQVSKLRPISMGQTFWYPFAVKIPSWSGPVSDDRFAELISLGYQTSAGSQVALGLYPNASNQLAYGVYQNAGYTNTPSGWAGGSNAYTQTFMPVNFGVWQEFVVGVKEATDNTGFVQVYTRTPGGNWSQVFDKENIPTYLYGNIDGTNWAADGSNWPESPAGNVTDKLGLYFGTNDNAIVTQSVQESGLERWSNLSDAESSLP